MNLEAISSELLIRELAVEDRGETRLEVFLLWGEVLLGHSSVEHEKIRVRNDLGRPVLSVNHRVDVHKTEPVVVERARELLVKNVQEDLLRNLCEFLVFVFDHDVALHFVAFIDECVVRQLEFEFSEESLDQFVVMGKVGILDFLVIELHSSHLLIEQVELGFFLQAINAYSESIGSILRS